MTGNIALNFKVNADELIKQLEKLDLSTMNVNELELFIKENLEVILVKSAKENRYYLGLKEG